MTAILTHRVERNDTSVPVFDHASVRGISRGVRQRELFVRSHMTEFIVQSFCVCS